MSAKVIQFPKTKNRATQLVDEVIEKKLSHKDPEILSCLKVEMKKLVEKYFDEREMEATLMLPPDLTEEQFLFIKQSFETVFNEHSDRMIRRANSLFLDLCLAKMEVCELRVDEGEQD